MYKRVARNLSSSRWVAILVSLVDSSLFHIFVGALVQEVMTILIGVALCLVRRKVKNCTILSLIVGHGLYDFLITIWVNMFL